MIKRITSFLLFIFSIAIVSAQVPRNIQIEGTLGNPNPSSFLGLCNEAGTYTLGAFQGESNDADLDSIFLCFGDVLPIVHDQNWDLSGDPQPTTEAGIGYGFFDCLPSVEGPGLADVIADPCVNQTSPILVNGIPVNQLNDIWVFTGAVNNGNIDLINNGAVQVAFNNGDTIPTSFWLAPMTVDNFAALGYEAAGAGLPTGPCVDVNFQDAFHVTWLAPIRVTNISNGSNFGSCQGEFRVAGGLPQLDATSAYTIDISLETDNTIKGDLTTMPAHGEVGTFTVPEPGTYIVTIEDGKSCGASFSVDMDICSTVTLDFPLQNATPGSNICVPLSVESFTDIFTVQFTLEYDPTVLSYTGFNNVFPGLVLDLSNINAANPGVITFSWDDIDGVSIPDGSTFFEFCFDVIGGLGEGTPLTFTNAPTNIEVVNSSGIVLGTNTDDGYVNVSNAVLFVLAQADSVTCEGDTDGRINVTVAEGTAPYLVNWNTVPPVGPDSGPEVVPAAGESTTIDNLAAGNYQITITDSNMPANTFVDTVEVGNRPSLGINMMYTPPACHGESSASIVATPLVDLVPQTDLSTYTFEWDHTTDNVNVLNDIPSGNYALTVTDERGCEAISVNSYTQPALITVLASNTNITDASCTGVQDGTITIQASGGTVDVMNPSYTYSWEAPIGVQTGLTSTVSNLEPGTYEVTISDENGCTFETSFVVGAVKTLSITGATTDISCNGLCDGQIFITGQTTGAPADEPYTFAWSSTTTAPVNTNTTSTNSALCAGTYTVTMTDASIAGCQAVESFDIIEPDAIVAAAQITNETCAVGNDGSMTVVLNGGTAPFTYSWSHDATLTDSIANGLPQGTYDVDIEDANGCTVNLSEMVSAPVAPQIISLDDATVSCPESTDGSLTVNAIDGAAPIATYVWSGTTQTGATITGLAPGEYIVTITDDGACTTIDTALVLAPDALMLDQFDLQSPNCPGDANGIITVLTTGGTPPLSYDWEDASGNVTSTTVNVLNGVVAGNYTVTITDANDCTPLVLNVSLDESPSIVATVNNIVNVTCPDDTTCDGQATVSASFSDGSTGNFNFFWPTTNEVNVMTSTVNDLCRGDFELTITDANNCSQTVDISIGSPDDFEVQSNIVEPTCFGDTDGEISVDVSGANGNYSYQWIGQAGEVAPTIDNLPAAQYTVVITDGAGCTFQQTIQLDEPDALDLVVDVANSTPLVSCHDSEDGVITVNYNNTDDINPVGASPYTWSDNVASPSSNTATGLAPGTYSVTLTDTRGCTDDVQFTIGSPPAINFTLQDIEEPLCYGDQTQVFIESVSGGTGMSDDDYQFIIDNNGLAYPVTQGAPVFGGQHTVSVVDPAGCESEQEIFINQPPLLSVSLPDEIVVELGDTLTQLNPIVVGGTQPYLSYNWTPGTYLSSDTILNPLINPVSDQDYVFTVIDNNGCIADASIFVELDANRNFFIPNVFAPNGNGPNDEFRVFACRGIKSINSAQIYDRWGGLIHSTDNIPVICEGGSIVWDGRINGNTAQSGVYVYFIEVTFWDDVTLLYRGDITLLY